MSYEDQIDPQLATIAKLVKAAVRVELGDETLTEVYEDPRDLFTIAADSLPAIAIYRVSSRRKRVDDTTVMREVVVAFDYALPSSDLEERAIRWPALPKVWGIIETVCYDGGHPSVQDGADVLALAKVYAIEDQATANYSLSDGGRQGVPEDRRTRARHPLLEGRITFEFEPDVDYTDANLADFLRMHTGFYLPGTDAEDMTDPLTDPENPERTADTRTTIPQD